MLSGSEGDSREWDGSLRVVQSRLVNRSSEDGVVPAAIHGGALGGGRLQVFVSSCLGMLLVNDVAVVAMMVEGACCRSAYGRGLREDWACVGCR